MDRRHLTWVLVLALGCQGVVKTPEGVSKDTEASVPPVQASPPSGTVNGPGPGAEDAIRSEGLGPHRTSPGVRLLSRREFIASVQDLTGYVVDLELVPDLDLVSGHGQIAAPQSLGFDELNQLVELGMEVGRSTAVEWDCLDEACARAKANQLLQAAVPGVSADGFLSAFEQPGSLNERIEMFVASVLASPSFLYRLELGDNGELAPPELAARMSHLVFGARPDATLLEAAEAGALDTGAGRLEILGQMLADPRARRGMRAFVFDWFGIDGYGRVEEKDSSILSGTSPGFPAAVAESLTQTVNFELFEGEGSFLSLLSTDHWSLDRQVAEVVGLEAGPSVEPVRLDPSRRGLLTHPGVVAAHSKEIGASPFVIGEFINEHILCEVIAAPPVVPEVDESETEASTLRERLEAATAGPACQGCHAKIGPAGFAFLPFDPVGRMSAADGLGRPWDTAGTLPAGLDTLVFDSAAELSTELARHPRVAQCVSRRLFRWTFGRFETADDQALLEQLEAVAVETGASMRDLLETLVGSDQFSRVRRDI